MKLKLPDLAKLPGRAGNGQSGETNDAETGRRLLNPSLRPRCRCSSCCPIWRTTARCAWTG